MIFKSYILENDNEILKKKNSYLFYGENLGLQDEIKKKLKFLNQDKELLIFNQDEVLDNSILLAKSIQDNFTGKLKRVDRGVKQAGFVVLARASMPNVLVELGFISNPSEEKKLRSPQYRDQLATAIYRAVEQYQKTL